jgi:hypothetical protein
MKNFLLILLNRAKYALVDFGLQVFWESIAEYRDARRSGHFNTFDGSKSTTEDVDHEEVENEPERGFNPFRNRKF